jgi:hypothetical protein
MSLFRRSRPRDIQLAGLQADVVKLRDLSDDLTRRLTSIETRPLPRPNPVTLEAFSRLEELTNDATRSAAIARADVAIRISNLDAVVTDLSSRLNADHDALRARLDDLAKTLEHQSDYLETHADQLALSLQGADPTVTADLQAGQTRMAKDLARLTIELRDEVAKLASIVKPGEFARVHAYSAIGSTANGQNGDGGTEATGDASAAPDEVIDLRS